MDERRALAFPEVTEVVSLPEDPRLFDGTPTYKFDDIVYDWFNFQTSYQH